MIRITIEVDVNNDAFSSLGEAEEYIDSLLNVPLDGDDAVTRWNVVKIEELD